MEFFQFFGDVLTLEIMVVLVLATGAGLVLGAMPGLSPTMAVALLIPFTFHMDSATGLVLLGAVYTATVAGGAISGILVNIPGAPANIATVLDGHPMARQGRASEALHYCFISSFIGGVIGVLVLIFFTPPLAELALAFGPAELFWIAIVGVTVIGSVGSKSVVKGLLSGAAGLWISTIGISPIFGEARFVFTDHVTGGVHVVAALIGLFAIPQVFQLMVTAREKNTGSLYSLESHRLFDSIRYNLRRIKALVVGTVSGIVVGIIPGAGGQIAGLVAYDQVRKFSGEPDRFGKGEPDGVIAAESANNAMVGPSLVPLLTLGVPGSPTAAVLLGGLLINGLFPGPDLFTVHAQVTWTFIGALLVAQGLMVVMGLGLSRTSSHWVMRVPSHYMAAAVTVLAVIGTYSIQNSYSDVLVMAVLGAVMYVGSRYGFSAAPMVLGIILGPIAEDNFQMGKMIADTGEGALSYFFLGTINIILIVICVVSIAYSIVAELKQRRRSVAGDVESDPPRLAGSVGAVGLVALMLGAAFFAGSGEAFFFPRLLALIMTALAALLLWDSFRALKAGGDSGPSDGVWRDIATGSAVIVVYLTVLEVLGFYASSFLAFALIALFYLPSRDRSSVVRLLPVSIVFIGIVYLSFEHMLQVMTPRGILF
ncbi:MAG: C4-dicarboxylate ABC transporter permease [Acidiferrobacteraceae bacterium]|nr:C4-dicarboxylate ABC transporter permease [Acidiferrobacteraceae bacterium]MDP6398287.1 tripartite tricarboxylate transporter permease [Arenicellales bacterium]MDP6552124.1 tripartite tricarboxylate transporter permease [Arenicellales bacterium]MDP6918070.1 tripartite tricarboxylate transporter permease [Arenicellales bacterium]